MTLTSPTPTASRVKTGVVRGRRRISPQSLISPGILVVGALCLMVYSLGSETSAMADTIGQMALLVALAQSWNLLAGFSGMVSLGIAAFAGTGSYTVGLLAYHVGWSWWLILLISLPVSLALAALLSVPLLRLRGDYFAIGSLAASLALQAIVANTGALGGSQGISLPTAALPLPSTVDAIAIAVGAVSVGLVIYMSRSRFGLRVMAGRDSEVAARTVGIDIGRNRMIMFLIGSTVAGVAGGVMALHDGSVTPDGSFAMSWTIGALLMAVVGGVGTVWGPVLGVVLVYFVLERQLQSFAALALIIEGLLLIVLIRVARRGLWPVIESGARYLARRWGRRGAK